MRGMVVAAALFLACSACAGEDARLRMLFRDYGLADEDTRPLSAGLVLWENKELPGHWGPYASVAPVSYRNWRIEAGAAGTWNEKKDRVEIGMLTGVSYRFGCNVVLGAWYAPFWGLDKRFPDDPWGLMIGYAFPTPGWTQDFGKIFRK